MKIMISGGHLTPALAVIDYILSEPERLKENQIIFIGREFSQEKLKQKALEAEEIGKRTSVYSSEKIKFIPFFSIKFVNNSVFEKLCSINTFFRSLVLAKLIITKEKPRVFLSFGGYLAVPIAIVCWFKHIPIITHEQTRISGMANKVLGLLATKIAITFESSIEEFSPAKVRVTGNPIRKKLLNKNPSKPDWIIRNISKPILLVMGGNQGSKSINKLVGKNLNMLLDKWTVIHQCGRPNMQDNYLSQLELLRQKMSDEQKNDYFVREWLTEQDLAWIYKNAFAAISRAGANSVIEIAMMKLPTIFIPLPQAYKNEQYLNAKWLVDQGAALILEQKDLIQKNLTVALDEVQKHNHLIRNNLDKINTIKNSDKQIYDLILEVVGAK
jgi:UDP-N-acetylglucosamine--N-acetylmuramyl-(pentapeptide) pyrophosphoryl-undecaprenol N-acetylglucosamine transferase